MDQLPTVPHDILSLIVGVVALIVGYLHGKKQGE